MPHSTIAVTPPKQRAFLFGLDWKSAPGLLSLEDSLAELSRLCETAGLHVVGSDFQRLARPDPATLIGSGKVTELIRWVEETRAEAVVFDEELSPRHLRELEKALGENVLILDRTAVILDIFSQHARSREGALQVELAQYEYRLPRLTRAWTHLVRQAGGSSSRGGSGGVGLRGPGETQLEIDRREIAKKITRLKAQLELVRRQRGRHRQRRRRSGVPIVALVGYTNAGKSTILNTLAHTHVYTADQWFATLDPTTRRVRLPNGQNILLSDTVGFIQKLPDSIMTAFRATLEEIQDADLLLHLVDITHPNALEQARAVHNTLHLLEIDSMPILTALNKVDRLAHPRESLDENTFGQTVMVSAKTGEGLDLLLEKIEEIIFQSQEKITVLIPHSEGKLVHIFHEEGLVESIAHQEGGILISGRIPVPRLVDFRPYRVSPSRIRKTA
jgi:GTPase